MKSVLVIEGKKGIELYSRESEEEEQETKKKRKNPNGDSVAIVNLGLFKQHFAES